MESIHTVFHLLSPKPCNPSTPNKDFNRDNKMTNMTNVCKTKQFVGIES